ncbi:MAG TPA: AIPR family protein [Rhizobium sp.]
MPAKVIVLHSHNPEAEELLISDISRYANSQNAVKVSDLSANKPFHVELEKLALSTYCPDGTSRWFYERAAGSYNVMLAREGTTPARLRQLKEAIPPGRKITKTDLAKYLQAWGRKPQIVSLGNQKNFDRFMSDDDTVTSAIPDVTRYKHAIAQTILFRTVQKIVRVGGFQAYQANIAAYTVAALSEITGSRFSLDAIWQKQGLSSQLSGYISKLAVRVNDILRDDAGARQVSEWAKKDECWDSLKAASLPPLPADVPETSRSHA